MNSGVTGEWQFSEAFLFGTFFFFFLPFDFCLLCSLVLFCFLQLSSWVPGVLHGWAVGLNGVLVSFGYISKCIFTQQ